MSNDIPTLATLEDPDAFITLAAMSVSIFFLFRR